MKVLIADDDQICTLLQSMMLKKSGLSDNPILFSDGSAVLNYLNDHAEDNEQYLLFLDIHMPDLTGWEVLDAIQLSSCPKNLQVVLMTASINRADSNRSLSYPQVLDYFEKPLTIEMYGQLKLSTDIPH